MAFFYLTNFGIPLFLAAWAAITGGVPARLFLVAWVVALFLVPNLFVAGAVVFDMNKYFQVMWVAVAILAAWAVRNWPQAGARGRVWLVCALPRSGQRLAPDQPNAGYVGRR